MASVGIVADDATTIDALTERAFGADAVRLPAVDFVPPPMVRTVSEATTGFVPKPAAKTVSEARTGFVAFAWTVSEDAAGFVVGPALGGTTQAQVLGCLRDPIPNPRPEDSP